MPTQANLMGAGCPALQAQASVGLVKGALTALGSNQATALALPSDFNVITSAALSTGAILPLTGNNSQVGDSFIVVNHGANPVTIYPPVGGTVANQSVNTGLVLPVGKQGFYLVVGTNAYSAAISA